MNSVYASLIDEDCYPESDRTYTSDTASCPCVGSVKPIWKLYASARITNDDGSSRYHHDIKPSGKRWLFLNFDQLDPHGDFIAHYSTNMPSRSCTIL